MNPNIEIPQFVIEFAQKEKERRSGTLQPAFSKTILQEMIEAAPETVALWLNEDIEKNLVIFAAAYAFGGDFENGDEQRFVVVLPDSFGENITVLKKSVTPCFAQDCDGTDHTHLQLAQYPKTDWHQEKISLEEHLIPYKILVDQFSWALDFAYDAENYIKNYRKGYGR